MPSEIECCCACRSTVPTQWLRICVLAIVFPSLLFLTCLLHSRHVPALTDAWTSSSQDSSQKSQRIVHPCSRIVEQIVDVPVPQILEQIVIESIREEVAHGSGAVIQWRRTLLKS